MADVNFDEVEGLGMTALQGRLPQMVNLAGAVCSLALIAGLAVWGYKLAVRDVNGIPVMRALADPMRMAPDKPGGNEALHQGLSVNAVAAFGTAAPMPETLILAPRPVELAAEDMAGLAPAATAALGPEIELSARSSAGWLSVTTPLTGILDADAPLVAPDAVAAALAEALGIEVGSVRTDGLAPATSPRPLRRGGVQAVTGVEAVSASAPAVIEVDPATLAVGTRLVQFGTYDDAAVARTEWLRLVGLFPDLMAGKAMVVQQAQSGGRSFYRLRAHGFAGEDDARRFCTALEAESAACVPVAQR